MWLTSLVKLPCTSPSTNISALNLVTNCIRSSTVRFLLMAWYFWMTDHRECSRICRRTSLWQKRDYPSKNKQKTKQNKTKKNIQNQMKTQNLNWIHCSIRFSWNANIKRRALFTQKGAQISTKDNIQIFYNVQTYNHNQFICLDLFPIKVVVFLYWLCFVINNNNNFNAIYWSLEFRNPPRPNAVSRNVSDSETKTVDSIPLFWTSPLEKEQDCPALYFFSFSMTKGKIKMQIKYLR